MFRPFLIGAALLSLAACGKKEAAAPDPGTGGEPQIATSLDDYTLPVDRSAQVTAIDAATGDAGGMPKDGGAVVSRPKREAHLPAEPVSAVVAPVPPPPLR